MAIYTCSKDLEGKTLNYNDTVIFKQFNLYYTVHSKFLQIDGFDNDTIFNKIGKNKLEFCSKYYGYPASYGGWPECRFEDFPALTRVVKALFLEIEKQDFLTISQVDQKEIQKKGEFHFTHLDSIKVKF